MRMGIGNSQGTRWGWDETGPVWGARAYAPKSGQDHLGLGSVSSDQILPILSLGINVLTIHPRYWSFYSWVLDDFWTADLPRISSAFRDFYQPREALFAMGCHVCDASEHRTLIANVVGSRRVGPKAEDAEFDPRLQPSCFAAASIDRPLSCRSPSSSRMRRGDAAVADVTSLLGPRPGFLQTPVRAEQRVRNLAWVQLRLVRQAFPTFRSRKSSSACSHHQGRLQS
jgi:hypothetical protein